MVVTFMKDASREKDFREEFMGALVEFLSILVDSYALISEIYLLVRRSSTSSAAKTVRCYGDGAVDG